MYWKATLLSAFYGNCGEASRFAVRGPGVFPVSIALMGMRDLKDYITAAKGGLAPIPVPPSTLRRFRDACQFS
jgi:hypothetical protein